MKALEISRITFSYNKHADKSVAEAREYALRNFSMSVKVGQFHALLGPNGAGKTTLMRLITGQLRGYEGEVIVFGHKNSDKKALSNIGYAPQPVSVYTTLTALENLRVFGVVAGLSDEKIKQRSEEVLKETGLLPYAKKSVSVYSGGMLRRLNLAVALLHSPLLLLLDEPTVGVDPQSRNHIYETLAKMNNEGVTIVLCTHIMEEAQRLCATVTVLDRGSEIFSGYMKEIDNLEKFFLERTGHGLRDD
ncbi:MAG TPA: ABC transporter ATP-binding protein [Smithellaceae bacterium]|jgi:ABC-2 type transport system ATP-binding protein|nr:MAG: putative ABC transporter ATP-binding protein YxlF [Deltaproteobacteria bacterium ADurb.BinA014]HNT90524.1 ABC transporter ATP-binding protein [Smithellaceae bacterium]HNZ30697.1 ABC transporter ATP-binding protein [Smithellaceae bacterium]HPG54653.1 ABC transporter ATP-binding protein [Smithellaceae bacterium]HPM69967.1 ABC transporter ATP-binding protein [Smithellaceae bacterium]